MNFFLYTPLLRLKEKDGSHVMFREDHWLGEYPGSICFPHLYRPFLHYNILIPNFKSQKYAIVRAIHSFFKNLKDQERLQSILLLTLLSPYKLFWSQAIQGGRIDLPNVYTWKPFSKFFTQNPIYQKLAFHGAFQTMKIPSKVKGLIWIIVLN